VRLLRPARKGEPQPAAAHLFRPLRQVIESINQTFKGQLDLRCRGLRVGSRTMLMEPFATEESAAPVTDARSDNGQAPAVMASLATAPVEAQQEQGQAAGPLPAAEVRAFHERLVEPGERDRLRALLVTTTERADRHLAILSAMVTARAAYQPQLRTEELLAMLPAAELELDFDRLVDALDALKAMGCVDWAPDTRHVTRKEDMYRRRAQWYLTAVGVAATTRRRRCSRRSRRREVCGRGCSRGWDATSNCCWRRSGRGTPPACTACCARSTPISATSPGRRRTSRPGWRS